MNAIRRFRLTCLSLVSSLSLLVATMPASAVTLLPANSTVAGKTIAEWTTEWWKWAFQQTNDIFTDPTAGVNQSGSVYFLTSAGGVFDLPQETPSVVSRSYQVPGDKYLLVPILNSELGARELGFSEDEFGDPGTADSVRNQTIALTDKIIDLSASINGVSVTDIDQRRYAAPFEYNAVVSNIFGVPARTSGPAYADGYWLMIAPVGTETFSLNLGGVSPDCCGVKDFVINTADTVTGVPVSEPTSTLGFLAFGTLGAASALKRKLKLAKSREKDTTSVS